MKSDSDALLMQRAAQDDAAFAELFDRYYPRAVNVAYRMLGDRDLAEDTAMEAFARIYESRAGYRPTAAFGTYLYRVVSNLSINACRRRSHIRLAPLDDTHPAPASDGPEAGVQQAEFANAVRAAVLALPERQRMALVLTRYEGLCHADAAEVIGVSTGAVESLLHRAKCSLRKSLEHHLTQHHEPD